MLKRLPNDSIVVIVVFFVLVFVMSLMLAMVVMIIIVVHMTRFFLAGSRHRRTCRTANTGADDRAIAPADR